jgi:hypothetical protein
MLKHQLRHVTHVLSAASLTRAHCANLDHFAVHYPNAPLRAPGRASFISAA